MPGEASFAEGTPSRNVTDGPCSRIGRVSHAMISTSAAPARVSPRLALVFYSVAILLAALAMLGVFNPGGYVVVAVLFDHPFVFGVLVLAALAVACWVGPGPVAMRATGLTLGAVAAFGYAGFGALNWMSGSPQHQIVTERAPAGQLEFRVIEGAQVIDTVWELRVRRPAGLLSKEWSAGCLNGDNPDDGVRELEVDRQPQHRGDRYGRTDSPGGSRSGDRPSAPTRGHWSWVLARNP